MSVRLVVLAKSPRPGRSKTRLCPPLLPGEAAWVAEAALADTLTAVAALHGPRPLLALDGPPGPWLPPGFAVTAQRGGGLDERIAAALGDAGGPALLIGMDTPQVTPALLAAAAASLEAPGIDAVLGLAEDGGWWALGLRRPDAAAVLGIPTSTTVTGLAQRARLELLGLAVGDLPALRDVDLIDDARAVAAMVPGSRFARTVEDCLAGASVGAVG